MFSVSSSPAPKKNLVWVLVIAIPMVTGLYILVDINHLLVPSSRRKLWLCTGGE